MSAVALITGVLCAAPEQKTSKSSLGDASQYWRVVCFNEVPGNEL